MLGVNATDEEQADERLSVWWIQLMDGGMSEEAARARAEELEREFERRDREAADWLRSRGVE